MKISNFSTDSNLELNGVWLDIGLGAKLLIARDGNPAYVKEFRKHMDQFQTTFQRENLTEDEAQKILISVTAKTILLDWEGIDDEDGNPIPYSEDQAIKLLTEYKDFRTLVETLSKNSKNYKDQRTREVIDNIKK